MTKPLVLSLLGLPLSEKQIPQVVENLESGVKRKEALERAIMRPRHVRYQAAFHPAMDPQRAFGNSENLYPRVCPGVRGPRGGQGREDVAIGIREFRESLPPRPPRGRRKWVAEFRQPERLVVGRPQDSPRSGAKLRRSQTRDRQRRVRIQIEIWRIASGAFWSRLNEGALMVQFVPRVSLSCAESQVPVR